MSADPRRIPFGQVLLLALLLVSPAAVAHGHHDDDDDDQGEDGDECVDLTGVFVARPAPGPGCASPIGFCTAGELDGDLVGTYAFAMTSSAPAPDDPTRTDFTGASTIRTDDGVVYGQDHGSLSFGGDFAFVTVVRAIGGAGCFEEVSGTLVATGHLDPLTGTTSGTWTATFCGADCFDDDDDQGEDD